MTYRRHIPLPIRLGALFVILVIHGLIFVGFENGDATVDLKPKVLPITQVYFPKLPKPQFNETPPVELQRVDPPMPVIKMPDIDLPKDEASDESEAIIVVGLEGDPDFPLTAPKYPEPSLQHGEQGRVVLMVFIMPDGRVGRVKIVRSSGYALLDEAAKNQALNIWRFRPIDPSILQKRWRIYNIALSFVVNDDGNQVYSPNLP